LSNETQRAQDMNGAEKRKPGRLKRTFAILKEAGTNWWKDDAPQLGAALAYYSIFALGPLLLIAVVVAGVMFGEDAAKGEVMRYLRDYTGPLGAQAIESMLVGARKSHSGGFAAVVGVVALVFTAIGVVVQLKSALNKIWHAKPKPRKGIWGFIRDYVISLGAVLAVGLLVAGSFVTTAVFGAMGSYVSNLLPIPELVLQLVSTVVSLGMLTVLFALMFKVLPDTHVHWKDVWVGAAITSLLFTLGKLGIGMYIGKRSLDSTYGAAGAFLALMVWVYYSSMIVFFGASFTEAYSRRCGSRCSPQGEPLPRPEARAGT